ncbi:MAG: hypothetical protein V4488_05675 [Pseudomonadota bacterium]
MKFTRHIFTSEAQMDTLDCIIAVLSVLALIASLISPIGGGRDDKK